jgi:phospholipid/cholesterol/gamma-HCH transport system substrate-binding protein
VAPTKTSARQFVFGVGALAILIVVGVVAFTANQGRLPWTQPAKIRAEFADIGQLQVGSDVRQNGLPIGQVSHIDLVDGHPIVTMAVNNAQPMYRDGYAGIYDQSSLALKFVELRSGNPASGLLGGGILPISQTESTHDLVQVLDIFDVPTRDALGNELRQLGGGMAGYGPGLQSFIGSLPQSLSDVRTVSDTLADKRTDLPALLVSTDRVASRFSGHEQILSSLLKQTDATLQAIDTDDGRPLGATISKLPNTLSTVRGALEAASPPLADLAAATRDLRAGGAESLGKSTSDLRGAFREARQPFHDTPGFSRDARPAVSNLKDTFAVLRPFVPRLGGGIGSARTPLAVWKPYSLDLGTFFTDLDSLVIGHEGWTHHFRGMVSVPSATSLELAPIKDASNPYPKPGEVYTQRDVNGSLIPGDPGKLGRK